MSLWSFQGARGLDLLAHLQSDRKPADRRLTDLSKLNSALAARLSKLKRSACDDEVDIIQASHDIGRPANRTSTSMTPVEAKAPTP